jgi:hypothetical protein
VEPAKLFDEAYTVVSGEYGPEQPDVQDAAAELIENLMDNGDFSLPDDYARINYETLIRGADPDSLNSAVAMRQIADIRARKPTDRFEGPEKGEEAENLAKIAHQIILKMKDLPVTIENIFLDSVISVSIRKGQLTVETRDNLEHVLKICLTCLGSLSATTAEALHRLGQFYLKLRPFDGTTEFIMATFLMPCARMIQNILNCYDAVDEKDKILAEIAAF